MDFDDNQINERLGAARDYERPGNRPAFNNRRNFMIQGTSGSGVFSA